jgi:hypothetical protein
MAVWAGRTARLMTGFGTNMEVIARPCDPSVKESIDEHSTPNMATTSPAPTWDDVIMGGGGYEDRGERDG